MELSPTAKVVLGMLRSEPASGYEIKAKIDCSTSFFWSAGYGSIYPELKRLSKAGLIEGVEDAAAERKRVVYHLTAEGRAALDGWLEAGQQEELMLRDEHLLGAFFAEDGAATAAALIAKAENHARVAARLREIEATAAAADRPGPLSSLHYGLAFHEYSENWCREEADRLLRESDQGSHSKTDSSRNSKDTP